ncbi:hypothetical protein J5N58_12225 [Rhizobium cremeum]|uniref:hypothetical protein n=1 Tax=Rhizobium cremeum TaxID=2813827 RepID=UPI001FD41CBB|nr:hypothetical protein [Rhizobium cremeum]MCJ7995246.1 hypothetical protein [Rhizobium cremeum]MCJ8000442.1 hypothetical protein [Rhizobium cremeum]
MTVNYAEWIAARQTEAQERGGGPWTPAMLAKAKQEANARRNGFFVADRTPGEIVNPETGEIVTDCVTIGTLAETFGITAARLTDLMEQCGIVHRVLAWKDVPMLCNPVLRKPVYYRTPEAAPAAIRAGLVVQIKGRWGEGGRGMVRAMILITPKGQQVLRQALITPTASPPTIPMHHQRRERIDRLHRAGRTASEIIQLTGIPRRTVFRDLATLRRAA